MDTIEAIRGRHSTRAFLDRSVDRATLERILDTARWSASGTNCQPWFVEVVSGDSARRISTAILARRAAGVAENPDYHYYPEQWVEPYKGRRKATGLALYGALGIAKGETEKMEAARNNNYRYFGAPVALFLFMDRDMGQGSWIDMGIFLQSLMLAARAEGLASCPQAALAEYPDIVRAELAVGPEKLLLAGLSLGYEDTSAAVNQYRLDREPVAAFTRWHD